MRLLQCISNDVHDERQHIPRTSNLSCNCTTSPVYFKIYLSDKQTSAGAVAIMVDLEPATVWSLRPNMARGPTSFRPQRPPRSELEFTATPREVADELHCRCHHFSSITYHQASKQASNQYAQGHAIASIGALGLHNNTARVRRIPFVAPSLSHETRSIPSQPRKMEIRRRFRF